VAVLRIGHLSTFYHTSILILAKGDAARVLDADVAWRMFGTGPEIIAAFGKRELDLAYVGLPPSIIGIDRGVKIRCVGGGHIEGTVFCGKNGFRGFPETDNLGDIMKQFRGLKVGVPGTGSIHDVILQDCIERFGLRDEVEVIHYSWADRITEAAARDELSAAIGTPALAVALRRYAKSKVLYPPSRLWPSNPSYGILADCSFLAERRKLAERFLAMHEEATSVLRNRPEEASGMISNYVGIIDKEFILDTIRLSPKYCAQITEGYIDSTMRFVKSMKQLGYIHNEVPASEIFDTSLIEEVHPGGSHYEEGIHLSRSGHG
jgi:NitT/TauT family transport system substrate-binding protein